MSAPGMPGPILAASGAVALGFDHVKDAVVASAELIDVAIGENVCLEIATFRPWLEIFWLLANVLGSANPGEPPGDKVDRLVIAEASEHRILAGEIVVQAHIEFLLQFSHRDAGKVEARSGSAWAGK
jgi:hypothetical protein